MKIDVRIRLCDRNAPAGKLADAEVHFLAGALQGLKLVGFAVWQRRDGNGCNVTFPSRQFIVHGNERTVPEGPRGEDPTRAARPR